MLTLRARIALRGTPKMPCEQARSSARKARSADRMAARAPAAGQCVRSYSDLPAAVCPRCLGGVTSTVWTADLRGAATVDLSPKGLLNGTEEGSTDEP